MREGSEISTQVKILVWCYVDLVYIISLMDGWVPPLYLSALPTCLAGLVIVYLTFQLSCPPARWIRGDNLTIILLTSQSPDRRI